MLSPDRTRVDEVCLALFHELAEPLSAIACEAGAARRWLASQNADGRENLAASVTAISSEIGRAMDVMSRLRSYLQKEAREQLDNIEKKL